MVTTITHNGKVAKEPTAKYQKGQKIPVNETMELFINGKLQHQYITHLEISVVEKDYVVKEDSWYIWYEVKHMYKNQEIATYILDYSDIKQIE